MKELAGPLAWTLAVAAALATAFAQLDRLALGEVGWLFDLFAQFPRHWAVASLVAIIVALLARRRGLALLSTAALAANLTSLAFTPPYATPKPAPAGSHLIRIVSANLFENPKALAKLAGLARAYDADVVSTYETPALEAGDLHALFPGYQIATVIRATPDRRPMSSRILVALRTGAGPIEVVPVGSNFRAFLRYNVEIGGSAVQMTGVHTAMPARPALMADRDLELAALGHGVDLSAPFLIFGDLNTTPWAAGYSRAPGVRAGDPRFEATFPAKAPLLGLPIDHVRFGGGLELVEHHVGPDIGSDHLPVFATFALPRAVTPPITPPGR